MNCRSFFPLLLIIIGCAGCSGSRQATSTTPSAPVNAAIPSAEREFRAAWVATVANINWPSKPGLSSEQQQREAIGLLDYLKNHHFNAVILQVRPQTDALYQSDLEPWSYFLSGTQGKAPEPYYDPLAFWIREAHARGIELHAWLNPYRAHHISGGLVSDSSIVKRKPGLMLYLKEGYWWMDPALKGTQDHSAAVVRDLVRRYDLDGIHFDDYFYPYPSYNKNEDFPDSASYAAYRNSGGMLSRGDWRRDAVNTFIQRVYTEIKAEKKHVKFGLSPFGIWRPGHPEGICCFDQYDVLYADAKLWLNKGWIDYFTPQLYWPIRQIPQSFPVLLGWWQEQNTMQRHLWPGINVGRDTAARSVHETLNQIMITRGMVPKSKGVIHWSISSDTLNPVLSKAMIEGPYKKQALIPASPWLDNEAPAAPSVTWNKVQDSLVAIQWTHTATAEVAQWVIYYQHGTNWQYRILPTETQRFSLPLFVGGNKPAALQNIIVTAVDRYGNESSKELINGIQ